ncbi:hypothetical protein Hypma_009369 [Hypsizygus marmoreus]|uniref:Uncharacterized protein n=1 Tax=Hypsizygus marmoreus TaxID=39966 RepID=A0A369JYI6_HYPMA|nr:hypothetical protein Hypma_009369 [Hypsizygus marmoreus]
MPCNISDITPLRFPGDPAGAPQLYIMTDHPLLPLSNTAYIVLRDLSETRAAADTVAEKQGILGLALTSYVCLKPGNCLFSRDINGLRIAEDDILEIMVLGGRRA